MTRLISLSGGVLLVLLLSACAGTGGVEESGVGDGPPDQTDAGEQQQDDGVDVSPMDEDCKPPCAFPRNELDDPQSPLADRLVFFDFDSAEIKPKYKDLIVAHGEYLASYPDVTVRLEGHTDERGSREYNLALGEDRAKSVRQLLLLQGVPEDNISVVSFGEELPLDPGEGESAWSQNRRVELVYEDQ
jgi:peptidoglycan-associated lipoprotein